MPLYSKCSTSSLRLYICAFCSQTHPSLRKAIDRDYLICSTLMFSHTAVSYRASLFSPHKDVLISFAVLRDYLPAGFTFHPITQSNHFLCEATCGMFQKLNVQRLLIFSHASHYINCTISLSEL